MKQRIGAELNAAPLSISSDTVVVESIEYGDAKGFIEQYEWLGNLGAAQFFFGLKFQGELLAVSCYMRTTANRCFVSMLDGLPIGPVYQLCRGATSPRAPKWAASKITSASLRMLRASTGALLVVAYADPRAGEVGVVYQASNAIYLGLTNSRGPGEYLINGERLHPRTVHRRYGSAKDEVLSLVDPNYKRFQRTKKHRYVFVLAQGHKRNELLKRLSPIRHNPPRRSSSD